MRALLIACAYCGRELPPTAKFCLECGQPTGMAISTDPRGYSPETYTPRRVINRRPSSEAALEGERKHVTVLFADLKGSMELLADRDPEEARKLLDPVLKLMMEAVHHYAGTVNQAAGDGIMALFGAPLAHEDHAIRACYAALRMQENARQHAREILHASRANIQIRVGINSGEVVVGTIGSDLRVDYTAVGRTTHLAARMEQLAPPGSILLAPRTFSLVEAFVTTKALGSIPIKGLADTLEVYELTGRASVQTRFQAGIERGLASFVGRDAELALLERALEDAARGDGRVVGVMGEAGVGKSRLCFEFVRRCRERGVPVLEGGAVPHERATPYAVQIKVLKVFFRVSPDDSFEQAREKIRAMLEPMEPGLVAELPLLVDFLGLSEPGAERLRLDPTKRRKRLNGILRRLTRAAGAYQASRPHPAVILLEDLHWMDEGGSTLTDISIEAVPGTRILYVVNYRPGFEARWMRSGIFQEISLSPMRAPEADALAQRLLGNGESIVPLLPLVADRARGNPLFIEELVRQLEETGNLIGERGAYHLRRAPDMRNIPDTVQAIIGARMDGRPKLEKFALQAAAVIGREFTDELLACLTGESKAGLRPALRDLSSAGLIFENPKGLWSFKHPMMQEVAYRSLLSDRRRVLHRTVAAELQRCSPEPNGGQASLIAYHWEEAGNTVQAIESTVKAAAWYGAGDVARRVEWDKVRDPGRALDAWKRVHRLLTGRSLKGAARQELLAACGQVLSFGWREGMTSADLSPYYVEALETARSLGRMQAIVLLNAAYGRALAGSGSANDYLALANDTLGMFASPEYASLTVQQMTVRCHAHMLVGDLHAALADNDYVFANLHRLADEDAQALGIGYSPPIWAKYMRGRIFALMGRYDEARAILDELIASDEVAVNAGHQLRAHLTMMNVAFGLGDQSLARMHGSAARRVARTSSGSYFRGVSRICSGLEFMLRGEHGKATAMFSGALRNMRNPGLEGEAAIRCHLAHAQLHAGLIDASRSTAEEAAGLAKRYGNKIWLAYAVWLLEGSSSPTFSKLVEETGAEHFMRLHHPRRSFV